MWRLQGENSKVFQKGNEGRTIIRPRENNFYRNAFIADASSSLTSKTV